MPLIAMTREMGSLGKDVADALGDRMSRRVVYHEIIEPLADRMRIRKSHVIRYLDGRSNLWERLTTDQVGMAIFTADETFKFLRDGTTGVIRGWGSAHLLRDVPHVIRVRVCAPFETKVLRMMERLRTDNRQGVEQEIAVSEEAHTAIARRHFGLDWRQSEHYDVVLSTERLSVAECVDEIECAMRQPRFQETAESLRMVENLAVQWSVKAALRCDENTAKVDVTVTANAGHIELRGVVSTPEEARAAEEVASRVSGVWSVRNLLRATRSLAARAMSEG